MFPGDAHASLGALQSCHHSLIGDDAGQRPSERLADPAHAAHRLHHRCCLGGRFAELHRPLPEFRRQELLHIQRLMRRSRLRRIRRLRPSGPCRATIDKVLVQRAEVAHERSQAFLVVHADRLRQQILVHRLGRQLRDNAAHVVYHAAIELRRGVEGVVVLHQRAAVVVAHHLERDAKRAAVPQDALVVIRQPGRSGIEIEVLVAIPRNVLRTTGLNDGIAATQRPVAAAGARSSLQDEWPVARLAQFVGQHHSGDAGTDDNHAPAAAGRQRGWPGIGRRRRQQAHRGHGVIGSRHTAGPANQVNERAAG